MADGISIIVTDQDYDIDVALGGTVISIGAPALRNPNASSSSIILADEDFVLPSGGENIQHCIINRSSKDLTIYGDGKQIKHKKNLKSSVNLPANKSLIIAWTDTYWHVISIY